MGDVAEVNFDDDPRKQEKDELKAKLVSVYSAISDIEAQIRQLSLAEQNSLVENLTADISSDLSPNASSRHQPAVTATSPPPVTQSHQPIATATSPPPLTPLPQPLACLSHPNTTLYRQMVPAWLPRGHHLAVGSGTPSKVRSLVLVCWSTAISKPSFTKKSG